MQDNELTSELEFLILAMVSQGITSGYGMRCEMQRMRGGRWSAESGSVYRVLRRLVTANYLVETGKAGVPNRERTEYALTKTGEQAIREWLISPLTPDEVELLVDPVRTRTYFLQCLTPPERVRAVKAWTQQNKRFVTELSNQDRTSDKSVGKDQAHANLVALAKARGDWLKKLMSTLKAETSAAD